MPRASIARLLIVILSLICLHFLLTFVNEGYGEAAWFGPYLRGSDSSYMDNMPTNHDRDSDSRSDKRHANATLIMLARNDDVEGAVSAIRALEDRFNHKHHYPYVFLNDAEFSRDFKSRISAVVSSRADFGVVPREHWNQPSWIDEKKAEEARERMVMEDVKYGGSVPYRNMCRFNSGFFFKHPLLQKYRWYWRVEPSVRFHCDVNEDPFLFLEDYNKTYGFTIAVYEIPLSIPSLWGHVRDFIKQHPEHIAQNNAMNFISYNQGISYNRCHFWSNFEIADMDFWRSSAYQAFFNHLDQTGGFYYERWGDAPIHSIAASLFLQKDQIHFFENIGYQHDDWSHCPLTKEVWAAGRCACAREESFDYDQSSCKVIWDRLW